MEFSISHRLFLLEIKLPELEARLEDLVDKLEFAQEDIGLQLLEVKDEFHKARIDMCATQ